MWGYNAPVMIQINLPLNDTDEVGLVQRYSNVVGSFANPPYIQGTSTIYDGRLVLQLDNLGSWQTQICAVVNCTENVKAPNQCFIAEPNGNTTAEIPYTADTTSGGTCCVSLIRTVDALNIYSGCVVVTAKQDVNPSTGATGQGASGGCAQGVSNYF